MDRLRLQAGYTLIEVTISLSLAFLLLSASLQIFLFVQDRVEKGKARLMMQMEAAAFLHYLEREISCTEQIFIAQGRMFFFCGPTRYDYKLYGNYIVREVDSKGWIEVCLYVKDFQIAPLPRGILLTLTMERGGTEWGMQTVLTYSK
ncbi:hypothetical protein [Ammoniphilus sp. 3BR4]|uniref:hypothetical protein n=1 Tax=Ammoniphilus sp. 3BR4 TaxID=3158265 RepID=UPI0034675174